MAGRSVEEQVQNKANWFRSVTDDQVEQNRDPIRVRHVKSQTHSATCDPLRIKLETSHTKMAAVASVARCWTDSFRRGCPGRSEILMGLEERWRVEVLGLREVWV